MVDAKTDKSARYQLNDDVFSAMIVPAELYDLTSIFWLTLPPPAFPLLPLVRIIPY
jgi:hypothetical protein